MVRPSEGGRAVDDGLVAAPTYSYWLNYSAGRVRGAISRFREGTLTLDGDGVLVDGRAVLPQGQQVAVLVASVLLCVGALLAAILLEYVIRTPATQRLRWHDVDEIVLERAKSRACIVHRREPGSDKRVSLPFKLPDGQLAHFADVVRYFAPGKIREGKIGGPTDWIAVAVVVGLVLVGLAVVLIAVS